MTRKSTGRRLAALLWAGTALTAAGLATEGFRVSGPAAPEGVTPLLGGGFALEARAAPRRSPQGGGFVLTPGAKREQLALAGAGGACACFNLIFADDFESGSTGEWDLP